MSELRTRLDAALDQYRIESQVGEGGAAVVFLAEDSKHQRQVALKVMKPDVGASLGSKRFLREIDIAAKLSHPHIVPLYDSGEVEGLHYIVMPYVEGESLRERLKEDGSLPLDEAVRITGEIAGALDYAHARGLIHRDIKPENILFQSGHAAVTDFGIARGMGEGRDTRLTETGVAVGTVAYMSPEQASGETDLDARTDVYALGCVLYEMLEGGTPFAGHTPQAILAKKVTGVLPEFSTDTSVPGTVAAVVRKALAAEPDSRYATPADFAESLETATTVEAIEGHAARRRSARRHRVLGAVAGIVLLGFGGVWITKFLSGPAIERVAVLHLTNAMNDPAQDFFVEGVHADLIKELSRAGLGVITPTSVLQYRNSDRPVNEIARDLGVDAIIEGSASLAGNNISLDLRMTDGVTDEIVWFDAFEAEMRDVLSVYGEVTRAIASAAGIDMNAEAQAALANPRQVSPEVQKALWQARFHRSKLSEEGLSLALDYFQLVLSRDPGNAEAFAGIAVTWGSRAQMGFVSQAEAAVPGREALARAIEIDSTMAEVQHRLASTRTWTEWDWAAAESSFRRSIDADPTNSGARASYSHLLQYLGLYEEAAAQIELAVQQDPFNAQVQTFYAMGLNHRHEYEAAEDVLNTVLSRSPDYRMALTTRRTTLHLMGRHEEALEMWKVTNARDPEALEALDRGYEEGGYSGALRSMAEMLVARSDTTFVTPWQIATAYTRAGDSELALDYLELAYEAHDSNMPYLSVDPIFDALRDEPRFRRLIQRLGLPN